MTSDSYSAPHSSRIRATYLIESPIGVRLANSASILLRATKVYFFVFYIIGLLAIKTTYLPIEYLKGRRSTREVSVKV
jgi:hypothetical protein